MGNHIVIPSGQEMEIKLEALTKVKVDADYYCTYYIDTITKEKWVKEHLEGEMHAGGPPQLRLIEIFPWEEKDE